MTLKKNVVFSQTDIVDFQDHYILGNVKIYNSSDSNFHEISKQSSYNQAVDQMVDGPSSARLAKNGNFMRTQQCKVVQLPSLKV